MPKSEHNGTPKEEVLEIPERLQIFDDPRSHAKSVALTFTFPDGVAGVCIISRLNRFGWDPKKVIKEVKITYN